MVNYDRDEHWGFRPGDLVFPLKQIAVFKFIPPDAVGGLAFQVERGSSCIVLAITPARSVVSDRSWWIWLAANDSFGIARLENVKDVLLLTKQYPWWNPSQRGALTRKL